MKGIIVEGVAGSGKSTLLKRILDTERLKSRFHSIEVIPEEETLGELFSEISGGMALGIDRIHRLTSVMSRLSEVPAELVILERFHQSYYALGIDWKNLDSIDAALANLGFQTILLDLNEAVFGARCFERPEMEAQGWQEGFIKLYGSLEKSVLAFKSSQERRRTALDLSRLPKKIINTSAMNWFDHADEAISFILGE